MIGKSTKMVSAIFAVALMIMVAFAPVAAIIADDKGVDAAAGDVFTGYKIQLFKADDKDFSNLVYYGASLPAGVSENDYIQTSSTSNYWINKTTGAYLRCGDIPGFVMDSTNIAKYMLPMIQITYQYNNASVNNIVIDYEVSYGTTIVKSSDGTKTTGQPFIKQAVASIDDVSNVEKHEGIKTITLTQTEAAEDRLWIAPEMQVGEFSVTAKATQGVSTQTVTEKVNAGAAITISGIVKDANNVAIAGASVTPTVNGVSKSALVTDKDGKYSLNVVSGSTVSVIASYTSKYSFTGNNATFDFGKVTSSITKDFVANEKTAKINVVDANGNALKEVISLSATPAWYSEAAGSTADKKIIASATGTVNIVNGVAGTITVAYKAPTAETGKTFYLIAIASNGTSYTFTTGSITTGSGVDSIATQINNKGGMANIAGGSGTFTTVEKTAIITVNDKGNNPAALTYSDATNGKSPIVSPAWYSQKANASDATKYDIATVASTEASAVALDKANAEGKVFIAYKAPTAVTGTEFFLIVSGATNSSIYSFTTATISATTGSTDSIGTMLNGKTGSANAASGSATIHANETTFAISGTIAGVTANAPIVGGILYKTGSTQMYADVSTTGTYKFYVNENSVVSDLKLSNTTPLIVNSYTPTKYDIGTVTGSVTCNFAKVVVAPALVDLVYKITGLANGTKAVFTYTVDGAKYTSTEEAAAGIATLTFKAEVGATVTVSATAPGYTIPAFAGYSAAATTVNKVYFVTVKDIPETSTPAYENVPNFEVNYYGVTDASGKEIKGTLKTDKDGISSIDFNGTDVLSGIKFNIGVFSVTGTLESSGSPYVFDHYYRLDVTKFVSTAETGLTLNVKYTAAYNQYEAPSHGSIGDDQSMVVKYGETVTLTAPSYNGFDFKCWMIDGVSVSDKSTYDFTAESGTTAVTIDALYGATQGYNGAPANNTATLVIGIIAVVIALIGVAYVVIQKKD